MAKAATKSASGPAKAERAAQRIYQAPEHTSAVFLSGSGELRVDKAGLIRLPADAPESDHRQLLSVGCKPLADEPAAPESEAEAEADPQA